MSYNKGIEATKAVKATIQVAGSEVDVYQLPNGSYVYSQLSATRTLGLSQSDWGSYERSIKGSDGALFAANTDLKALSDKGSDGALFAKTYIPAGRTRIAAVSQEMITGYWVWKLSNGNKQAMALVMALIAEALNRRSDAVFAVNKTEAQYETQTAKVRQDLIDSFFNALESQSDLYYDRNDSEEDNTAYMENQADIQEFKDFDWTAAECAIILKSYNNIFIPA
jgi:hypothetical protein